jgi:hypothetical protein
MHHVIIHNFNALGMPQGEILARAQVNFFGDACQFLARTERATLNHHTDTEVCRYEIYDDSRLVALGPWPLTTPPVNLHERALGTKIYDLTRASGSFYRAIGEAFRLADSENFQTLALAFPDLVRQAQTQAAKEWAAALQPS